MASQIFLNSVFLKNLSPLLTEDAVRYFLLPHLPDANEILRIDFKYFAGSTQRYCQVDFRTSSGVTAATALNGQCLLGVPLVITVIDPAAHTSILPPSSAAGAAFLGSTGGPGPIIPISAIQQHHSSSLLPLGLRPPGFGFPPRETEAQQLARTVHVASVPAFWTLRQVIDHLALHVKQLEVMTLVVTDSRLIEGAAADFGERVALLELKTTEMAEVVRRLPLASRIVEGHELIISQAKTTVTPREPDNVSFDLPPSVPVPVAYQQLNKLKLQEKVARARALAQRITTAKPDGTPCVEELRAGSSMNDVQPATVSSSGSRVIPAASTDAPQRKQTNGRRRRSSSRSRSSAPRRPHRRSSSARRSNSRYRRRSRDRHHSIQRRRTSTSPRKVTRRKTARSASRDHVEPSSPAHRSPGGSRRSDAEKRASSLRERTSSASASRQDGKPESPERQRRRKATADRRQEVSVEGSGIDCVSPKREGRSPLRRSPSRQSRTRRSPSRQSRTRRSPAQRSPMPLVSRRDDSSLSSRRVARRSSHRYDERSRRPPSRAERTDQRRSSSRHRYHANRRDSLDRDYERVRSRHVSRYYGGSGSGNYYGDERDRRGVVPSDRESGNRQKIRHQRRHLDDDEDENRFHVTSQHHLRGGQDAGIKQHGRRRSSSYSWERHRRSVSHRKGSTVRDPKRARKLDSSREREEEADSRSDRLRRHTASSRKRLSSHSSRRDHDGDEGIHSPSPKKPAFRNPPQEDGETLDGVDDRHEGAGSALDESTDKRQASLERNILDDGEQTSSRADVQDCHTERRTSSRRRGSSDLVDSSSPPIQLPLRKGQVKADATSGDRRRVVPSSTEPVYRRSCYMDSDDVRRPRSSYWRRSSRLNGEKDEGNGRRSADRCNTTTTLAKGRIEEGRVASPLRAADVEHDSTASGKQHRLQRRSIDRQNQKTTETEVRASSTVTQHEDHSSCRPDLSDDDELDQRMRELKEELRRKLKRPPSKPSCPA